MCNCPICNGRDINEAGIDMAENKVIPFFKNDLLKLPYKDMPFPIKYRGLVYSLMAYSQALAYDIIHNEPVKKYYTDNKWLIKFKDDLNKKFPQLIICDVRQMNSDESVREVCEFNIHQ